MNSVDIDLLIKGLAVGIAIAAPVGPVALLCIQRALTGGWLAGSASGVGAAAADTLYGSIAAFSLSLIENFLMDHRYQIAIGGGVLLCLLGLRVILMKPPAIPERPSNSAFGLFGVFLGTFVLTLANPTTVLSFIAIFAAINISAAGGDYAAAGILVAGVFAGSAIWWLCLAIGVGVIRHRMDEPVLRWIRRASAGLVIAFGIYTLWRGISHY